MSEVTIFVVDTTGAEHELRGAPGQTVMELAVASGIEGIEAECGGACSCATCHVYIESAQMSAVGDPPALEAEMLDYATAERRDTSRLCCQIKLRPELNGLRIVVAGQ